eukprot:COSAG02_NODE_18665_length_926_cov_1.037485_1_plen_181_part_00
MGALAALGPVRLAAAEAPFGPTFSKRTNDSLERRSVLHWNSMPIRRCSFAGIGTVGFVLGFIPGSLVTRSAFDTCSLIDLPAELERTGKSTVGQVLGSGAVHTRHVISAAVLASGLGQLVVLACGTLWVGLKFRIGPRASLDAGFVPFLPGLVVKSLLCGAITGVVTSVRSRHTDSNPRR